MKVFQTVFLFFVVFAATAQDFDRGNHQFYDGFFDFSYDESKDKIYLEVDELNKEFLYVFSLSSGVGSNDIGLDRGQLGGEKVVYFKKAGNKLMLVQPNLTYRANTDNELEKRSVEQAFAKSVLYGFEIIESKNGSYLIDITDFLMQDAHGVAKKLRQTGQGSYSVDRSKSSLSLGRTKAFPKNVEFEAELTFKGEPKSWEIQSVTPDAGLVTVVQHHSFVELPDDGYKKRAFDPRSGSFPFSYYDYATPLGEPMKKRYIYRHRLEKKYPNRAVSEAVEPIVYYLDNGTPEPVRSALLEGGRWWNQAFEAIGYKDAFQLKVLPDDADPMDVRYNVIQWVHRSTRGWSYGGSVSDPRTGEIIKGHVSLGSLRIRQDLMIAQGLMNKPFAERDDNHEQMLDMALARIRQLSAHEIGHTLGFSHNFAASTNDRASVMDYPHPLYDFVGNEADFSSAYDTGIGEWDKVTVAYAYSDFPDGTDEAKELQAILKKANQNGLVYLTDQDARSLGSAHPATHLWDNGVNAADELDRMLALRQKAIGNFSIDNIRTGEPLTQLEDVFVPLYFSHRYQVEAVSKSIGGLNYSYATKGDGQEIVEVVPAAEQRRALRALLQTVKAEEIAIPQRLMNLFPPRAFGYGRDRESFKGRTGFGFDALSAAETAADMSFVALFHPQRASRLVQQYSLDQNQLSLAEVIDEVLEQTIFSTPSSSYHQEVQQTVNYRLLDYLMTLAKSKETYPQVNAIANQKLRELKNKLSKRGTDSNAQEMVFRIEQFYENPEEFTPVRSPKIPDGSPIGSCDFLGSYH